MVNTMGDPQHGCFFLDHPFHDLDGDLLDGDGLLTIDH